MRTRSPSCRNVPSGEGNGTTGSQPGSGSAAGAVNRATAVMGWRSTAPAFGWSRETRRQLGAVDRLLGRRLGGRVVGLFVLRQAFQLISEQQRMMRRHFEFLPARLARHLVVQAQQVVAQLVELGAVFTALRL